MLQKSKSPVLILLMVCLILLSVSNEFARHSTALKQSDTDLKEDEAKILYLINEIRLDNGMDKVRWNDDLASLARSYSNNMAKDRFFSHFNRNGETVVERARKMKIVRWKMIGENLFKGTGIEDLPRFAIKGWMKSPQHKKNIMERRFNETGIGLARSSDGTIYATQVFLER